MLKLHLYTTVGCHLCEEAEKLLIISGVKWRPVEISEDDELVERYGIRIPVLGLLTSSNQTVSELGWPFSQQDLAQWLADYCEAVEKS